MNGSFLAACPARWFPHRQATALRQLGLPEVLPLALAGADLAHRCLALSGSERGCVCVCQNSVGFDWAYQLVSRFLATKCRNQDLLSGKYPKRFVVFAKRSLDQMSNISKIYKQFCYHVDTI